ncbi:hypothetical protein DFH06DRAFT_1131112 [Mycena polygramma]|nr:hypothetical protein DFH06DRAFT_1131112 [Mycena polygramma]
MFHLKVDPVRCLFHLWHRIAQLSEYICRLGETAFGNPSRDFTLVDNPDAPDIARSRMLVPQSMGRGAGLLAKYSVGLLAVRTAAIPHSRERKGERDLGRRWKEERSRGNPYFLHIGGVVDLQGGEVGKGSCPPVCHLRSERRGAVSGETGFLGVW